MENRLLDFYYCEQKFSAFNSFREHFCNFFNGFEIIIKVSFYIHLIQITVFLVYNIEHSVKYPYM
jgi:hypothetical protein